MLPAIFSLPYAQAHAAVRWLSPNHRMSSFTETVFHHIQIGAWALGAVLLAFGAFQLIHPRQTKQWTASITAWLGKQLGRLPGEFAQLWRDARPKKEYWPYTAAVLVLIGAAVLVRWLFLSYPMRYDESYTVVTFAALPWRNLVSDYSLPNNHIFHTVLVKLAMQLFGGDPWVVRLPAFVHLHHRDHVVSALGEKPVQVSPGAATAADLHTAKLLSLRLSRENVGCEQTVAGGHGSHCQGSTLEKRTTT